MSNSVNYNTFEFGLVDKDYVPPPPSPALTFQVGQTQQSAYNRYYRPPNEAFNYHWQNHGIATDAQIEQFNKEYEIYTNSGLFSQSELAELEELREGMLTGSMSPWRVEVPLKYFRSDLKNRDRGKEASETAGIDYTNPTTFSGAKQYADSIYMGTLYAERDKYELNSPEYKELSSLINQGAPDFQTQAEFQRYNNADEDDFFRIAADAQAATMQDYLNRNNIQLETGVSIAEVPYNNELITPHLNTGTALNAYMAGRDNFQMGAIGDYNIIGYSDPKETSTFGKLVQVGLQIAAFMNPTLAPLISGAQTLLAGGDLEDALKAGAKSWAGGNLTRSTVSNTLADIGITPEALNMSEEIFNDYVAGTITDVAVGGESLEESLQDALLSDAGDVAESAVAWAKENLPSLNFDLPEFDTPEGIEAVGNFIVDAGSAVGEAFEPVIDAAETVLEPVVDAASEVGRPVEDFVKEVGSTAEDIVEPFKDTIKNALSNIDPTALLAGTGTTTGSIPYSPAPKTTQVENLFDKELFKFDTEIGISPEYKDLMGTTPFPSTIG